MPNSDGEAVGVGLWVKTGNTGDRTGQVGLRLQRVKLVLGGRWWTQWGRGLWFCMGYEWRTGPSWWT